jgi:hypothetical protein
MTFLKRVVSIVLLFTMGHISAAIGVRTAAVPIIQSQIRQQVVQPKQFIQQVQSQIQPQVQAYSFANALSIIMQMPSHKVFSQNVFTPYFIDFVKNNASSDVFARALFEEGAAIHAVYSGNDRDDYNRVVNIRMQIDNQMNALAQLNVQKSVTQSVSQPSIQQRMEQPRQQMLAQTQPPIAQKTIVAHQHVHLLPTDAPTLRKFDLCPLFDRPALSFVFKEKRILSSGKTAIGFEGTDVDVNASCIVPLGFNRILGANRTLMQLKSLSQFELADATGLDPALCAGHSLNNGRLIRAYALTGNVQNLTLLHSLENSANFLLDLNIGAWLNVDVVREKIAGLRKELGVDGVDVSAVSTVSLFDSNLDKKPGFEIFDQPEFAYVQKVKRNIQEGLKKPNYVHIMIIGNEETVEEALGHYFCFAIVKSGNTIQYVVLDTVPRAYHLQAGSHERDRLMFVIDNVELGYSSINVANIRVTRLKILEEERIKGLRQ